MDSILLTGCCLCAQVAAAVFALRGTRLTKAGTVQADIQLMKDRDAELYYAQRALKHVHKHIRRLTLQQPDVQWGFFTTGARSLACSRVEGPFVCAKRLDCLVRNSQSNFCSQC